jgi:hypothetical protein
MPRLLLGLAVLLGAVGFSGAARAGQSLFWLQTDGSTSQLGSTTNPQAIATTGDTVPLYLWLDKNSLTAGFDGIGLDVRLISSDGGIASATIAYDEPAGRWYGATGGGTRTDSGGIGVEDSNVIDLTNTDTCSPDPLRLATIYITGVTSGTVQVFLCVGAMGIADGGNNAMVYFGLASGSTAPETQLINGGVPGLCSTVPEAVITVTPQYTADFDHDNDVDQTDFAHLQLCLSGSTTPQTDAACADTLLNGDPYVDSTDVALFAACMSGPGVLPPAQCR